MMHMPVLVIDDEPDIRELLQLTLKRMGLKCHTAATCDEGYDALKTHHFGLVLTDMRLPDGDGIDIVRYIQHHMPQLPVAVITAYGNVEGAVNTLKAGAFDYVSKPVDLTVLKSLVQKAMSLDSHPPTLLNSCDRLVGQSIIMTDLKQHIEKVSRSQAPVFIHGESGVGKELVAHLIHDLGPRADKPFIAVNCGAIPSELMESEFFGHKRGSFTGAVADKQGLFEAAQGGTLFLDELVDLPMAMQVKLLRAIQEKAIKPVGAVNEINVDVRILSASHKDLNQEVAEGRFRQDLYYRIHVIELNVPPLRARLEDITQLAPQILNRLKTALGNEQVVLSPEALAALHRYHYPGNVRELENILERAIALCEHHTIKATDLHLPVMEQEAPPKEMSSAHDLDERLELQQKQIILDALDKTKWNRTAAAQLLGVSFRTLRYRLKKLGLD